MANFLRSKFFLTLASAALVLTVIFLGQQLKKKYQIHLEIKKLETDISSLEQKNQELLKLINNYKTPEYQERQARQLLNLQKPGEFAVVLPPQEEESTAEVKEKAQEKAISNLKQWWDYFFRSEER